MGISGLLPLLKDVTKESHVSNYKGKVLGVDAYVWLHRGAYGCAEALATGRRTDAYVKYAMGKIRMLQHYGVTPYVVFDGDRLPAKAGTEDGREKRRAECLAKALQLNQQGNSAAAREQFVRCIDVTPAMAYQLIKALRAEGIQYIVAPYEADAQLAYLERRGVIDGIISEDSDLLVFGCKTVLYKLRDDGLCDEITYEARRKCKALPLHSFGDDKFRQMAILSGCDYLPSLPKMGIKTACDMLRKYKTVAQILAVMASRGTIVPADYKVAFERAERTFVYQRVFDRDAQGGVRLTTLTSLGGVDNDKTMDDCIGPLIIDDHLHAMANGDLDPISRQPIEDLSRSHAAVTTTMFSQNRSRWIQQRKGGSRVAQSQLPRGQKKLEGFFSKQPGAISSQRCAKPLAGIDLNESTGRVSTQRPAEKSPFFAKETEKESPRKVYEGNSILATFSTPPTQKMVRKRRPSDECSIDGLISSPSSTVADTRLLMLQGSPTSDILDDAQSSPITSPSMQQAVDNAGTKEGAKSAGLSVRRDFDQFRFDASSSKTIRTPLNNITNKVLFRSESETLSLTKTSSSSKRTLHVDDHEQNPFQTPSLHRSHSMWTPSASAADNARPSLFTPGRETIATPKQRRRLTFE
jgi:5'-3' exonuclease